MTPICSAVSRSAHGRFGVIACDPFPYGTTVQRQQWQALIATLQQSLRLHRHQPRQLLRLDAYLHERTDGMIGDFPYPSRLHPPDPLQEHLSQ